MTPPTFYAGVAYFFTGMRLIMQPSLRPFVMIPLLVNTSLFVGLFFALQHFMGEFNAWVAGYLPAWLQWLAIVFWGLFFVSFLLLFVFAFVTVANVLGAPFNSLLAEKVEMYVTGHVPESRGLWDNIKDVPRIVLRQWHIVGYYLPRALFIFILFFVPVIQVMAAFIWFCFHAWIMALTYLDYPSDNHRVSMHHVREWLHERRGLAMGFGVSVLVASSIPIVNFFAIPAAVAGATALWLKEKGVSHR